MNQPITVSENVHRFNVGFEVFKFSCSVLLYFDMKIVIKLEISVGFFLESANYRK